MDDSGQEECNRINGNQSAIDMTIRLDISIEKQLTTDARELGCKPSNR
jgi:hypothetical protein